MHFSAWFSSRVFFTLMSSMLEDRLINVPPHVTKTDLVTILDVGSASFNGDMKSALYDTSFPTLFDVQYIGLDFEAGPNVDIVVSPKDKTYPYPDNYFDAIISNSALEHDPRFWMTYLKMLQALKPGGLLYISVPYEWIEHRFPVDCWRFYGDSGPALESWGQDNDYNVKLVFNSQLPRFTAGTGIDTVMVFYKQRDTYSEEEVGWVEQLFSQFRAVYDETIQSPQAFLAMARNCKVLATSGVLATFAGIDGTLYEITYSEIIDDYEIVAKRDDI